MCLAAREAAASGGPVGVSLARVLTTNIAARLSDKYQEDEEDIMSAMKTGITGHNCASFKCNKPFKSIWASLLDQSILYFGVK